MRSVPSGATSRGSERLADIPVVRSSPSSSTGRSRRTTLADGALPAKCWSASITSYGGATTSPRSPTRDGSKRRARNGRRSGNTSLGMTTARGLRAQGTAPSYDSSVRTATDASATRRRGAIRNFHRGQASLLRPSPPDGSNGDGVSHHRSSRVSSAARLVRMAVAFALLATLAAAPAAVSARPAAAVGAAAELTEAVVLLDGHARVGAGWPSTSTSRTMVRH